MDKPYLLILTMVYVLVLSGKARSSDFQVVLTAKTGPRQAQGRPAPKSTSQTRSSSPRQALVVQRGESIQVAWQILNTTAKTAFENVLVHFFIVKEAKQDQRESPPLTKDVLYEGALTMDFKSKEGQVGFFSQTTLGGQLHVARRDNRLETVARSRGLVDTQSGCPIVVTTVQRKVTTHRHTPETRMMPGPRSPQTRWKYR